MRRNSSDEERIPRYRINPDAIDNMLEEGDEDYKVLSARAIAKLKGESNKKLAYPMIPGQSMASVSDLKRELEKARDNIPLTVSLLNTLIDKLPREEKSTYLKQKIKICIDQNRLTEAEEDLRNLLQIEPMGESRLILARVLAQRKETLKALIEYLRGCSFAQNDLHTNELQRMIHQSLTKVSTFNSLHSWGSNINSTVGDGTEDTSRKPKHIQELKGRVVLDVACGSFHTLCLVSNCLHLMVGEECKEGLQHCNGGTDVLVWGANESGQCLGYATPVKSM
jgi:tetratricopeptide (TPR) repeat protein